MNRILSITGLLATAAFICCAGCQTQSNISSNSNVTPMMAADMPSPMASVTHAIAVLVPFGDSKVAGKVTFAQTKDGVDVVADVTGLTPGLHGFHIHEFGDLSDTAKGLSAGGHYNPEHVEHGLPNSPHHHPGDMGNLNADADGHAHLEISLAGVSLTGDMDPILGRSIIVHEKADDGSQPTGNAGGRIAGAVIGVAKG